MVLDNLTTFIVACDRLETYTFDSFAENYN